MTETTNKLCPYCGATIELVEMFCPQCALYAPWEDSKNLQPCPYCGKETIGMFAISCQDCLRSGKVHKLKKDDDAVSGFIERNSLNKLGSLFVYFFLFCVSSMMLLALLWMGSCTLKAIQG